MPNGKTTARSETQVGTRSPLFADSDKFRLLSARARLEQNNHYHGLDQLSQLIIEDAVEHRVRSAHKRVMGWPLVFAVARRWAGINRESRRELIKYERFIADNNLQHEFDLYDDVEDDDEELGRREVFPW